ncbi:MAG TPA: sulfatase-like hydrolase/transferase [Vicinamibacteria bacterium]|nr:sulfatase-like hydrolase/transferase [Vicinamibacteria bacterium]
MRRDPGLSVLLITIDTLRADALGCYGRKGAETPWIDRLSEGGVRFEEAHAHNVVTLPSHANLLSGRYPLEHGVRDNTGFRFPATQPTLATLLKAGGWRTGGFVSAFPLAARFGLDRGFDVYDDRLGGTETTTAFLVPERKGTKTVGAARGWLETVRGQRFFAFVHLYEPHFPYVPPEPFASRFRSEPYHGEVAVADAALEPLLAPILAAGPAARTLVVLTSDHGESLGEHGEETHGIFAYEATLHVPLIVYAPGILSPRVVGTPVRHIDVVPTVLDALGMAIPKDLPGRSLLPLLNGRGAEPTESYLEALSASLNRGWAPLHGALDRDLMKYVDLPIPELYDLGQDPSEQHNLAASRPGDLDRMRALLGRLNAGDVGVGARVREEQATLERLRALGYLGSAEAVQKQRYTVEDDPKRLIEIDSRIRDVVTLYQAGDYDGAIAICEENIRRRPTMFLSYLQLAYLQRMRGRLDRAIRAAKQAVDLQPLDGEAVSVYGAYLTEAGRSAEAVAFLGPYVKNTKPNIDVLTALGVARARLGQREEALATFARARELDPSNAMVLVNAGTVYLMEGDKVRARQAFEAALDIDPEVARAHNSLGVIAAEEGRLDEAVARWKRAVELDPRDYQTLFNLGTTLRKGHREAEARPYLEAYLRAAPVALEARDMARVRSWLGGGSAP